MAERRLVITVGTSVFSSASWRAEGRLAVGGSKYRDWMEPQYLDSPGLRRTRGWETAQWIEERLLEDAHVFDDLFVWEPDRPRRYAAELNTLLRLFEREPGDAATVAEFTRRSFEAIELICPSSRRDPARAAAEHLKHVFSQVLEHPCCRLRPVLRGEYLRDKVEQFATYLRELPAGPVDLLVTGGYKAFALLGGLMALGHPGGEWRLLYLHEDQQGQLVIADLDAQGRWRQTFESGSQVVTELPPRPVGEN